MSMIHGGVDMNRYLKKLKAFLAEQSPNYGYDDANSILDVQYYYYTDSNPVDNAVIRCQFKELDAVLSKLSLEENNRVFTLAVDLYSSHARHAFLEGVHVGMRLFTELQDDMQTQMPAVSKRE